VTDWRKVLHGEMELITSGWDPEAAEPFAETRCEEDPEIRVVPEAPVHPRRVTHAVLLAADLQGLARFYREVGGLEELHRAEGVVFLRGRLPQYSYHLVLVQKRKDDERRYHHVSFELESEEALLDAESALRDQGMEPVQVVDSELKRSFFLEDPDGFLSEYSVRRKPSGFPELSSLPPETRAFYV
jgi:catechol 2,3-dioxygenase